LPDPKSESLPVASSLEKDLSPSSSSAEPSTNPELPADAAAIAPLPQP